MEEKDRMAMEEIKWKVEIAIADAVSSWSDEVRAELERRKANELLPENVNKHNARISFGLELSLAIMNQKLYDFIKKDNE